LAKRAFLEWKLWVEWKKGEGSKHMKILRIIFQIIIGTIFGIAAVAALSPLLASFGTNVSTPATFTLFGVILVIVVTAPNIRRAFGRSFLMLGAAVFLLPLSTLVLSGVVLNDTMAATAEVDQGAAAVGGVIAGGLMTGFAGFVGFVLGSVLLLTGLILSLGGRREVIVVERR